jgi:hypothetical protein
VGCVSDGIFWVHYRVECKCNPVRYFAILSMQRSGSGWFETLLNNHTNISSNGEIFSVKVRRSNVSTITETLDKIYNLDWLSSASKNECAAAVGLKWMLNQVKVPSLNCLLFFCSFIIDMHLFYHTSEENSNYIFRLSRRLCILVISCISL